MKTSSVVASVLLSTMALAAPLDKRAYATKTEVKMEYYTVFTTVTGARPAAAATSEAAPSYEEQPTTTTVVAQPTSAVASSVAQAPTSQAPPPVVPTTSPEPAPTSTQSPPPPPPAETTTPAPPPPAYTPPPPPSSTAAAPEPQATQASTGGGEIHTGGSLTFHPFGGALGACGEPIANTDAAVALGSTVFGDATVDYMTGKTTNPWCGKTIEITNGGNTIKAKIMDKCDGCTNGGLDTTRLVWDALTGGQGGAAGDRIFTSSWKVV